VVTQQTWSRHREPGEVVPTGTNASRDDHDRDFHCVPSVVHEHRSGLGCRTGDPCSWVGEQVLGQDAGAGQNQDQHDAPVLVAGAVGERVDADQGDGEQVATDQQVQMHQERVEPGPIGYASDSTYIDRGRAQFAMKITYDTVSDSISCPDLSSEQTRALQAELSAALMRNDPVQTVAARIMAAVTAAQRRS